MLPDVTLGEAHALDARLRAHPSVADVSYLGAMLMPEDEVLFCLFLGAPEQVRVLIEAADVRFERIVACHTIGLLAPPAS